MKTEIAFDISLQGYSVHRLLLEDIRAIQQLFEQCLDYMLLVDGHPAEPNGVEEDFLSVPSGKSHEDKFVFGIANQQKEIVGLLDTLCWYPNETTWWIDMLLFVPESRSRGLGEKVLQGFVEYARLSGAHAIMLGVVEDNIRAYKFWNRMGFEFVRETEPRQFGNKTQTVKVMQRILKANSL
jgi:ribosomal protein S18 acetylase RimI-like enzyme